MESNRNRILAVFKGSQSIRYPCWTCPFLDETRNEDELFSREFFIKDFEGFMQTTTDDDKMPAKANTYTAGLKLMRHVRDNVQGHTLHTLVASFSQVPIQISWERAVNNSSETATERLYGNAFTPMAAHGQPGNMRAVGVNKD